MGCLELNFVLSGCFHCKGLVLLKGFVLYEKGVLDASGVLPQGVSSTGGYLS